MPLRDHFHPPLSRRSWESFHSAWAVHLMDQLNMRPLPAGFVAEVDAHIGVGVGVDVATFEEDHSSESTPNGAVGIAVASPPALVIPVDFAALETFEIKVYDEERARTLVAAVELVSPANKDRPDHRRAFLDKCAAYLRESVSVIIVDVVTSRRHNFHNSLMELFGGGETAVRAVASDLYAIAYRVRSTGTRTQLEMWPAPLALGVVLPTLPMWLAEDLSVPLDLEAAYCAACRTTGIG